MVWSTLADAADRDYRLVVLSDMGADPDPQLHEDPLSSVLPQHAELLAAREFAADLQS